MLNYDLIDDLQIVQFYESHSLIKYIRDHAEIIRKEKINAIYTPGPISWRETEPGKRVYDTPDEMIIVFDSFVIVIRYIILSDMIVRIFNREEFYGDKKKSVHILGHDNDVSIPIPFEGIERNEYMSEINKPIKEGLYNYRFVKRKNRFLFRVFHYDQSAFLHSQITPCHNESSLFRLFEWLPHHKHPQGLF